MRRIIASLRRVSTRKAAAGAGQSRDNPGEATHGGEVSVLLSVVDSACESGGPGVFCRPALAATPFRYRLWPATYSLAFAS